MDHTPSSPNRTDVTTFSSICRLRRDDRYRRRNRRSDATPGPRPGQRPELRPDQCKPGNLRPQSASGKEGPAAMGKHSSAVTKSNNNRRPVYLTAVGLVVLSLGAVFVVRSFGSESGSDGFLGGKSCDDPTQIQLSTTPELQPQLESAAKTLANKDTNDGPCLQFTISAAPSAKVAQDVKSGNDNAPDL